MFGIAKEMDETREKKWLDRWKQLEDAKKNNLRINEHSPEYKVGIKEGRCRERGHWIQAISNMEDVNEALLGRIIGEVAKLYEQGE